MVSCSDVGMVIIPPGTVDNNQGPDHLAGPQANIPLIARPLSNCACTKLHLFESKVFLLLIL